MFLGPGGGTRDRRGSCNNGYTFLVPVDYLPMERTLEREGGSEGVREGGRDRERERERDAISLSASLEPSHLNAIFPWAQSSIRHGSPACTCDWLKLPCKCDCPTLQLSPDLLGTQVT